MKKVLIAGCGDLGCRLGLRLVRRGDEVWGLRRRPEGLPAALRPFAADLDRPESLRPLPRGLTHVVYAASPDAGTDDAYRAAYVDGLRHLLGALSDRGTRLRHLLLTSSTAVYGQCEGEWVDESSPTEPQGFRGRRLLEAEGLVLASRQPATVLRLAGIYGPGRSRLVGSVRRGTAVCVEGPPDYTNRIHSEDAAGALAHLLELEAPDAIYLGADDEPADRREVLTWIAHRLGLPPPPRVGSDQAPPRRQGGSKRVSNRRLRQTGFELIYPTFRDGYAELIDALVAGKGEG